MIINPENPKKPVDYFCKKCDFLTYNKKDFSRHLDTKKHLLDKNQSVSNEPKPFFCLCGKKYKDNSGLWRHKKKCNLKIEESNLKFEPTDKEFIILLLKENAELKLLISNMS